MTEKKIKFDGSELSFEGACQLLESPNFVKFTPSEKVHRIFKFAAKIISSFKTSSKQDIRYASILEKYDKFLLFKGMMVQASEIMGQAMSIIKRTNFETLTNDNERLDYFKVWSSCVRSTIQRNMGSSKPMEKYKEIVKDLESRKFDDDLKKYPLMATIFMEMGMLEGLSFPSPATRDYLEKAKEMYEKCNDDMGALHCQYKIAEWCVESYQTNKMMAEAASGEGKEMFFEQIKSSIPPEFQGKFGGKPEKFIEMMKDVSQKCIHEGLELINECVEKYTRDLSERNVFINMKKTKSMILYELEKYEEAYNLINNAIKDALIHYNLSQVYMNGLLVVKGDILSKMGLKYSLMAINCFKEQSRYYASLGRIGESERGKVEMYKIQKRLDESKFPKEDLIDKNILPFKTCSSPYCIRRESKPNEFKCCSRCRSTVYCSRKCQIKHWRVGHKKECAEWKKKIDEDALKEEDEKELSVLKKNTQDIRKEI